MALEIDIDAPATHNATRAANLDTKTYHLTLKSGATTAYEGTMPAGGKIENIPAGTYTGTLRSTPAEFAAPAFDTPVYSATVSGIKVTAGGSTPVDFDCAQTNAGVKFVYDASLATAGMAAVVPVVAQGNNNLAYSGANKSATGYFKAGAAALTLTLDGKPLTVGGSGSVPLTLAAQEVWTVTLKANAPSGGAGITVEVDPGTENNDTAVTLDPPGTPANPADMVLAQDFAACTGPALPVAGAVFNAKATYAGISGSSATAAGLAGWTLGSGVARAQGGVRIGQSQPNFTTGATAGSITTPALAALGSETTAVTVSFRAANHETAPGGITVSVSGGGTVSSPLGGAISLPAGTADGATIAESAAMKPYTVVVTGATSATCITFTTASNTVVNRFFLSDIKVSK